MYITENELEDYLKRALTTRESASFSDVVASSKQIIDNLTSTTFEEVSETSRYFDGGDQELDIDPCTAITAVASVNYDESIITTFDTDDYVTEPRNETIKTSIRYRNCRFPAGIKNIKVTAKFSSYVDSVPSVIKVATMKLCADIFTNPNNLKKESIEGYSYETGAGVMDEITKLLAPYMQIDLA